MRNEKTIIFYSDTFLIDRSDYGYVISFCAPVKENELTVVSRIGLSKEHIKELIKHLKL